MLRLLAALGAAVLFSGAVAGGGNQPLAPAARFVPCPDGVNAERCGFVHVPLDYAQPAGKRIEVFFALKEALSTLKQATPLFILPGGPGSSLATELALVAGYGPADYDLIGIEYRGGPLSRPSLNCPEPTAEALLTCGRRWQRQALDLKYFNSMQAAHDVEAVRRALGYREINLWGGSYGSFWAQQVMRLYPNSLRSAVLTGVLPAEQDIGSGMIQALDGLILKALKECQQQTACQAAHPDLPQQFRKQWPELAASSRHLVRSYVSDAGMNAAYVTQLPNIIERILRGGRLTSADFPMNAVPELSWGVNGVIHCLEQVTWETLSPEAQGLRVIGAMRAKERQQVCQQLKLAPLGPQVHRPVRVNVPTLMLTGEWDGRTPAAFLEAMTSLPPNWQRFILPGEGHAVLGRTCSLRMISGFLAAPTEQVTLTCLPGQK